MKQKTKSYDKFYIYPDKAGKWRWRAVAPNGRKVAVSGESFASKGNAHKAALRFMAHTWFAFGEGQTNVYEAKS